MLELDRETVASAIRRSVVEPYDRVGGSGRYLLELVAKALLKRTGDIDPAMLPPGDRRHHFDAALKQLEYDKRRGSLVERADVRQASAAAFAVIAQTLRSIPDNLERTLGIAPEIAEAVEVQINAALDDLANQLQVMCETGAAPATDSTTTATKGEMA
jgi:hypothetical protein